MGRTEEVGIKNIKGMPVTLLATLGSSGRVVKETLLLKGGLGNGNGNGIGSVYKNIQRERPNWCLEP